MTQGTALIIGAGSGLSASLARQLHARGHDLVLGARNTDKLADLAAETGARTVALDGSDPTAVEALFQSLNTRLSVAIYNPSARQRAPVAELDPEEVRRAIEITAFGSFLMGRAAAKMMQDQDLVDGKRGTILFTGASAGVKGFAQSAPFAMGKFAQRGLAQSMARELHPKGIHVAWINIDGGISNTARAERTDDGTDKMLDPDAIAGSYMHLIDQHRSAWSDELSLRPWVETF
ncbi:SDR family NAD(P)-dependent oxidoreductase [uncultured Tateyamaria sp.]|uniref:SDR family NAD(P)-dependent oxidoreductase n=1 Tax=uncultured Tateyamaria sp. TaxID=455651 RepID=UPI00262C2310|nr:SDR family NAD(P)-dependent oxidoreductase [uncultured Tateyamaria sp.]